MPTIRALTVTAHGAGDVLAVTEQELPAPAADQVQVDVAAAGVNFIDVYQRQGVYPIPTPFTLGLEGAGTVIAVGADVRGIREGDRVAWAMQSGSMATAANIDARFVVPVPAAVPLDIAAAAMLQGITAHYLTTSTSNPQDGDVVLVHAAAGGVGRLLVQWLTSRNVQVVATAGTDDKCAIAMELGARHAINYSQYAQGQALADAVREAAGRGMDVVYDGVGKATFEASLASLRPRGLMALYGGASGQVPPFDLQRLNALGSLFITRPSIGPYTATREELLWRAGEVFAAIEAGILEIEVHGRFALADAAEAYAQLEARATTGKLLVLP